VVKPVDQGSSLGVAVCDTPASVDAAVAAAFGVSGRVIIERRILGQEVTVGVVADGRGGVEALPAVKIEPADGVYDFAAKYERDDTRFTVGEATGLSRATREELSRLALRAHAATGCRHLSRSDFMIDAAGVAWAIEVNTLPGMTDHSLLPMAARSAGLTMPALCDRLLRAAASPAGSGG
jgi:D-alanine-D-alanine ligase